MRRRSALFVAFGFLSAGLALAAPARIVSVPAGNNTALAGLFRPPTGQTPVLLLLHGLASGKEEWLEFSERLPPEWGWLAYDARGHGQSAATPDEYRTFGRPGRGSPWDRMVGDVGRVVAFLEKEGVSRDRVVLMGASLGANAALMYAGLTDRIPAVVSLSGSVDYQGLAPEKAMSRYSGRALLIAHPSDAYAHGGSRKLAQDRPGATFWDDVASGHGVQMLDEKTSQRIIRWIETKK